MNAQSYLRRSAGALAIIMLMAAGCGRVGLERISSRDVSGNEERLSNSATVGAASHAPLPLTAATARKGQPPNQAETSVARQRRLVTLSCDFGIISPGTRPTKTVNLRNDSAVTWTVNSVSRNCACTVIAVDPHCIQPSAIASVEVELRGPFTTGDIDKDVMIEFHESAAPVVRLRAMARVRNPLTAFPDVVDLGQCLTGSTATEMLELHAFTSQQLSSIDVKGPDWLTIEQVGYPYPDAGSGPAQAWRFRITARTAALPLGGSEGIILARGVAPRGPEVSIPIFVYVKGPIDVSPREFFLGSVPRGEFAESCVTLTVAPQWRLSPRAAITISHDLSPEDVKIESQRRDWTVGAICGTVFVLRARYSPRCNRGVARGSVRVMISDGVLEQHCVEIPFCARAE